MAASESCHNTDRDVDFFSVTWRYKVEFDLCQPTPDAINLQQPKVHVADGQSAYLRPSTKVLLKPSDGLL